MTTLEQFVSPALTRALGWTLLHSLWQGTLVAAVLAVALLLLRQRSAEARYRASAGAMASLAVLAALTFGWYYNVGTALPTAATVTVAEPQHWVQATDKTSEWAYLPIVLVSEKATYIPAFQRMASPLPTPKTTSAMLLGYHFNSPSWLTTTLTYFDQRLPLLVLVWLLGLLAMSLRMLGGLLYVQRLRRYRVQPLGAAWQNRLTVLCEQAGVQRPVALLESALVRVPLVVGHLRPMILLPLGAVAGLPPASLEAILAHELAHVLRRDYLVNLLQTVVETVFFYHPAVWFIGGCLRTERENCCDDLATSLCGGDSLRVARALTALAEWSQSAVVPSAPRLALAAVGNQGALLNRVRRLVQRRPAAPTLAEGVMAGALLLFGLGLLGTSVVLAGPRTTNNLKMNSFGAMAHGAADDTTKRVGTTGSNSLTDAKPLTTTTSTLATDTAAKKALSISDEDLAVLRMPEPPMPPAPPLAPTEDGRPPRRRFTIRRNEPGTVVIEKDKKGRVKSLVVNGQPVEIPNAKLSKAERKAGSQVTVVQVPPASSDRNFSFGYSKSFDENMNKKMEIWAKDFDKQMDRKMDKAAKKLDKSVHSYVYVTPGSKLSRNQNTNIHIDIDDETLDQLANSAVALGNVSLKLGLSAAAKGLEEARRSLEATLRNPDLDSEARRATEQALDELNQGQAKSSHKRLVLSEDVEARVEAARDRAEETRERMEETRERARETRERMEETRERAKETRERRRELQERIRETQEELRALEESYRDGGEVIRKPRPPRAPLAPLPPMHKMAPMPPLPPLPPTPKTPPRAPVDNSGKVRDALRKDGLIGKNDKNFQFQLSGDGLKVNGQQQSAEMAAKYRKLLNVPTTSSKDKIKTNINISVQGD